jgi:ATP/maltotriose-dependent transcriptional regulator MalT
MSMAILATKLYIPPPRTKIVLRLRLIEQLNEGLSSGCKLTLISAPAGFGKTTLVSEWIASCQRQAAWLSLDEEDNDTNRFLIYLIAALQTISPSIGKGALAAIQSPQPPPTESLLTNLLNDIVALSDSVILVLDDYHMIDSEPIDRALTFLLDHLPPHVHLVIATREDPSLPLPRYRVRGQLNELRAADLRFTPTEAAEFLNRIMGLKLRDADIASLEARTEGWIAGLQLASLSMQGRSDADGFIQAFTGSHRFVLDYLAGEVLARQPERVRNFLLQTAILDRMSGSLCDAVTAQDGGRGMLETLERSNLFVVPLDNQRQWYRYHHLFSDVLQAHLIEVQPERVSSLHQRASAWYERNGYPLDAIHHALAARGFEYAAGLIEKAYPVLDASFRSATWLGWVRKLPNEVVRARPVLSFNYARALMDSGDFEAGKSWLQEAEKRLEGSEEGMVVADEEQFRILPVKIALARSNYSQVQGDIAGAVKYAELALELSPEEDSYSHAMASVTLGMAYLSRGDLDGAQRALSDWMNYCQKAGNIIFAIATSGYLAEIIVAQGRLREAERTYIQSIQLASTNDQVRHVAANLYLGLGLLYHEQGNQKATAQQLRKSGELGEQALIDWPYRWQLAQARLKEAKGDLEATLGHLDEARRLYVRTSLPDFRPIDALKARVYLRQGRLSEALSWIREQNLSPEDDLSYIHEFEYLTLVRVLVARYKTDRVDADLTAALELLERLLQAAEEGGRNGSVIEILVVQALALQTQGNVSQALASIERALTLAEPEGYVRIFVDEGEPMRLLILDFRLWIEKQAHEGHKPIEYVDKLLAAFTHPVAAQKSAIIHQKSDMVEPLSERELEVLNMLRSELSGPEIAQQLIVSLHTLRTHTNNIYNKLGVNNRRAAVRRAEELDLL